VLISRTNQKPDQRTMMMVYCQPVILVGDTECRVPSKNNRKHATNQTKLNSEKANSESHNVGKEESKRAGNLSKSQKDKAMHTKKKKTEYEYEANNEDRLNDSLTKTKETENVDSRNTSSCKINLESVDQKGSDPIVNRLNESFIHLRGDNFPNNDSFIWKPVGKKKKSTCFQMFACDTNGCNGLKKIRMFGNNKSFRKHSQSSNKIEVIYLQVHSCSSKMMKERNQVVTKLLKNP
jgi:hypothetical protein